MRSLWWYVLDVLHWWWVVLFGVFLALTGTALDIWQGWRIDGRVWVAIFIVGLFVAQFLAYHYKRVRPVLEITSANTAEFDRREPMQVDQNGSMHPVTLATPLQQHWVSMTKLLKVTNNSEVEAKRCRVEIRDTAPATYGLPFSLTWFDTWSEERDIGPFGYAYVTLIRRLLRGDTERWDWSTPGCDMSITVVAWAENAGAAVKRLRLQCPDEREDFLITELSNSGD